MTRDLHQSTQDLIRNIERKDRRFRIAQSVFMVLLIIGFGIGVYFAALAFQDQQAQRESETQEIVDQINQRLDEQSDQLRCVVEFFTLEDREGLVIRSVDDCFNTDRVNFFDTGPEGEQRPNFQPGAAPQESAPQNRTQPTPSTESEPAEPDSDPPEPQPSLPERALRGIQRAVRRVIELLP